MGTGTSSAKRINKDGFCPSTCGQVTGYYDGVAKFKNWSSANESAPFAYCRNAAYDFWYSADWTYGPWECEFPPHTKVWRKTLNTLFMQTSVERTTQKCFSAASGVVDDRGCNASFIALGAPCQAGAHFLAETCCCDDKRYLFNAGAEHLSIEFDHSFSSMYQTHVDSGAGIRVRTILRRANCVETEEGSCDLFEVPAGDYVGIPLQLLLQRLGIDLDKDSCSQEFGQESNRIRGVCPMARVTGMQIEFELAFFNFDMYQTGGGLSFDAGEPVAIVTVGPKITWNSLGNEIKTNNNPRWGTPSLVDPIESVNDYRYGVTIVFKQGQGMIGKFDFFSLMNTMVHVVVLVGLANKVTTRVARHLMGKDSKTFENVINERMSFSRELSRFTCQALIANLVLQNVDVNGDKSITETELKAAMTSFFKKSLGLTNVNACSKACMTILRGHEDGDTKRQPAIVRRLSCAAPKTAFAEPERCVDIMKLLDWMTDDRLDMDMLRKELASKLEAAEPESEDDFGGDPDEDKEKSGSSDEETV